MFTISRFSICLLFILSFSTLLSAQEQKGVVGPTLSPVITAATAGEKVRFSSPAGIAQIRVQIISATGNPLFDSAWKDGNVLDWPIESLGQPLANGSYRCMVMVKDLDGQVTQKEAVLTAEGGQVSIEPRAGNEGLAIVGAGESGPKITMLAHDEKNGAIVNTNGDLSFRFGEFFAGKDSERMRLTTEGNLGIGTDKPQAQLDVNGLIRTSKGIMFADGTILTTAAGLPGVTGGEVIPRRPVAPVVVRGGLEPMSPTRSVSPNGLTPHTAAIPDYQFKVDGVGVHIGTTNAYGLDVAGDVTLASNLKLPNSTSTVGAISWGGTVTLHNCCGNQANIFLGPGAGNLVGSGVRNTGVGQAALAVNNGGNDNVAVGSLALVANTSGVLNTAVGRVAMLSNTTGSNNLGLGVAGGSNLTTGSNNIDIGNAGIAAESSTMRIGTAGTHLRTFIAGINGVTIAAQAVPVLVDTNGQLGTASSSRRYKFDIAEMGDATDSLMRLRPVTFRYLAHGDNAPLQYGLIAEEVAEVYPEMVTRNKDGEVETVMYQFLAPMLLNEVQNQHRQIEEQQQTIGALTKTLDTLGQRLQALERQIARGK